MGEQIDEHPFVSLIIILGVLVAAFLIGYFYSEPEGWAQPKVAEELTPSKWDDHIDMLEKQALDEAFKKHIGQLYSVWVTDNYQPRIPPKALIGARHARDAYIRSMEAIEKREQIPRTK